MQRLVLLLVDDLYMVLTLPWHVEHRFHLADTSGLRGNYDVLNECVSLVSIVKLWSRCWHSYKNREMLRETSVLLQCTCRIGSNRPKRNGKDINRQF